MIELYGGGLRSTQDAVGLAPQHVWGYVLSSKSGPKQGILYLAIYMDLQSTQNDGPYMVQYVGCFGGQGKLG